jgi:hypothetical protein
VTTLRVRTTWITAQSDGMEHAVDDDAEPSRPGRFDPLCSVEFFPAPMEMGPRGRCPRCLAVVRARTALRDIEPRMDPKPSWANRLRCRRKRR